MCVRVCVCACVFVCECWCVRACVLVRARLCMCVLYWARSGVWGGGVWRGRIRVEI